MLTKLIYYYTRPSTIYSSTMTTTTPPDTDGINECNQLLNWLLHSDDAHSLNIPDSICDRFGAIITIPECVDYLCNNDDTFKQCYTSHYVRRCKTFDMMDMLTSFVSSILMYKYH